jgi:hypothetical protein
MRAAKIKCIEKLKQYYEQEKQDQETLDGLSWDSFSFLNNGLELLPSLLPNAGRGVFCTRNFEKNDIICEYSGTVCKGLSKDFRYRAKLGSLNVIDGYRFLDNQTYINPGSMINDAKDIKGYNCYFYLSKEQSENRKKNTHFENKGFRTPLRLFVVASKDIAKGSELYLSYGKTYWDRYAAVYA